MVTRSRHLLKRLSNQARTGTAKSADSPTSKQWIWPLGLAVVITVFHFSIDPHLMFWHDLLRRAYYLPIIWAVYQSGLRGGAISSIAVGAIFTVHLITGWGHHLGGQMDQVYDILGYLAVGIGVGYVVDRARHVAVSAAQREWDVSLRGVISAAIHELKEPKSEIRALASTMVEQSQRGMWEYSIGLRLTRASDRIDDLRRDLAGIAKILTSSSIITKPFDWALRFAKDPHLGGQFGVIVARTDGDNPPPPVWPISPQILDEVARCLLEDFSAEGKMVGVMDLTVSGKNSSLEFELSSNVRTTSSPELHRNSETSPPRGWVRMKLLELTWSRYNGSVTRFAEGTRQGFRLTLHKPRLRLTSDTTILKKNLPARRFQESNEAYIRRAVGRRSRRTRSDIESVESQTS